MIITIRNHFAHTRESAQLSDKEITAMCVASGVIKSMTDSGTVFGKTSTRTLFLILAGALISKLQHAARAAKHRACLIHAGEGENPLPHGGRKLRWCSIIKRAMRAMFIVVEAPTLEFFPRIGQVEEDLAVKTFVVQPSVEAFNVTVFHWLARPDQVQLHIIFVGPGFHCFARELAAVVGGDRLRHTTQNHQPIYLRDYLFSGLRAVRIGINSTWAPIFCLKVGVVTSNHTSMAAGATVFGRAPEESEVGSI